MTGTEMSLGELGRSMTRVERKLDAQLADHEKRLRQLERWMWGAIGIGSVGFASGLTAILTTGVPGY